MRFPWYWPLLFLLLALVGLGALALLWAAGAFLAVLSLVLWGLKDLRRRLFGPRWRRLPPP
ncbi:hypothetical protein ACFFFP_03485 [Thermus composti]|uniref:DUF4175 domain-containing protein n=1 Tax=Thermus composti TaxID=532059 RepID=A0ABV6Q1T0_9DEIN|nr:hypothetical protein [Thermus composti]